VATGERQGNEPNRERRTNLEPGTSNHEHGSLKQEPGTTGSLDTRDTRPLCEFRTTTVEAGFQRELPFHFSSSARFLAIACSSFASKDFPWWHFACSTGKRSG